MNQSVAQVALNFHSDLAVSVDFDAPTTSSDGGAILLRQLDDQLNLSRSIAELLVDTRDENRVDHSRSEQIRQRLYQISLGYEDCNDANSLRLDPLLRTACDRLPDDPVGLSSQPTLSRFENAVSMRENKKLLCHMEQSYVDSLPEDTETVILDIDSTEDQTHGAQQLTFFNGHYNHYMYHPLLVFDGVTGELVSALLRPGNNGAARGATSILVRIIRALKARFPNISVVVRGDSGFCVPRLLDALETLNTQFNHVDYIFGIRQNPALNRLAQPNIDEARALFLRQHFTIRVFSSFLYRARSWKHERMVIVKAEHSALGKNPRFIVTTLREFSAPLLYHAYCERGNAENFIKDFKRALAGDRLSCSTFVANFFRLLLHGFAYRLLHALRTRAGQVSPKLGRVQLDTLRLRLLKVAAYVTRTTRRIRIRLPRAFPQAALFRQLAVSLVGST